MLFQTLYLTRLFGKQKAKTRQTQNAPTGGPTMSHALSDNNDQYPHALSCSEEKNVTT